MDSRPHLGDFSHWLKFKVSCIYLAPLLPAECSYQRSFLNSYVCHTFITISTCINSDAECENEIKKCKGKKEIAVIFTYSQERERERERVTHTIRKVRTLECSHQSFIGHWLWDIVDDDWPRRRYLISAYHTCFAVPYLPALCASLSHTIARSRSVLWLVKSSPRSRTVGFINDSNLISNR